MAIKNAFHLSIVILAIFGCQARPEQPTPAQDLYANFQPITSSDTLLVGLDSIAGESSRVIPAKLFLAAIDSMLIAEMIYEPDTFDFRGRAYWKLDLDENFAACLIGIQQVWFHFKYLLIYSKPAESFVGLIPLAYLYGGDGGQIMCESRIFGLSAQPIIVTGYQEHYIRWVETNPDEPEVIDLKSVGLRQWAPGGFQEVPVRDSSKWLEMVPMPYE